MPTISIVTPCFNAKKFLPELVNSVAQQTFSSFEWIIVDDASTDGSTETLKQWSLQYPFVKLILLKKNHGVAWARNEGLKHADGEYIAFLDADDVWLPEKLSVQWQFMETHHIGLSYMDYERFGWGSGVTKVVYAPQQCSFADLLKGNGIGLSTAMVRRDYLKDIYFRKQGHEDYVFWLEILKKNRVIAFRCHSQTVLCRYRVAAHSVSANKFRAVRWQWHIYRQTLHLNLVKSLLYFTYYIYRALRKRI